MKGAVLIRGRLGVEEPEATGADRLSMAMMISVMVGKANTNGAKSVASRAGVSREDQAEPKALVSKVKQML